MKKHDIWDKYLIAIEINAYRNSGSPIDWQWLIGLELKNTQPNDNNVMKINRLRLVWLMLNQIDYNKSTPEKSDIYWKLPTAFKAYT